MKVIEISRHQFRYDNINPKRRFYISDMSNSGHRIYWIGLWFIQFRIAWYHDPTIGKGRDKNPSGLQGNREIRQMAQDSKMTDEQKKILCRQLIPTKTTLQGMEFTRIRQDGNSTRQIDNAVQLLFKGETVHVLDHWNQGLHNEANKNLFDRILDRLTGELRLDFKKNILIDKNRLIIKLYFE